MESETNINLGDQILEEYVKGITKEDIINKLNIDDNVYTSWEKINRNELKKIDMILEKHKLNKTLKIKNIPFTDSDYDDDDEEEEYDNSFSVIHPKHSHQNTKGHLLKREPKFVHEIAEQINNAMEQQTIESEKLIQLNQFKTKQHEIQEKMNKLIDLESQKKIGKHEYTKAMSILTNEMNILKSKILALE
jgi:hypothetical protein